MNCISRTLGLCSLFIFAGTALQAMADDGQKPAHTFAFGGEKGEEFLLDGKPFQLIGGELHPARIPAEYWRHRIRMTKAMGCNTIPCYVFWSDHEQVEGKFDFATGSRNIGEFLKIAKEEGMWVVLRPGPYCCGEWNFGGIPTYLLRYPDLKLRTLADSRYTTAVERYLTELAKIVRPNLAANGGPILMVQIENEYGSYQRREHNYVVWLHDLWLKLGVPGPFCTGDGAGESFLKDSVLPGVAVGLDPGLNEEHWNIARKMNPGVPVFSAETYPGWLTHWGEKDWEPKDVRPSLKFYMENEKSFSLYVVHGGTNFGFTAGANYGEKEAIACDLTSYDYGAPIDEQGRATPNYHAFRELLASYLPKGTMLPEPPAPIPTMAVPAVSMERWTSVWEHLPGPIATESPVTMESQGQYEGIAVYRTRLPAGAKGTLTFERLNDYGQVFVGGKYVGVVERRLAQHTIEIPEVGAEGASLDILVEGFGHINFHIAMESDRKGILGDVKLNDTVLKNWEFFGLPLADAWMTALPKTAAKADRPGGVFRGVFTLEKTADTFWDMSRYEKGVVWVNGRNLGRYWKIGPQQRLYCPASWLKVGRNEILVLDQHATGPQAVVGCEAAR